MFRVTVHQALHEGGTKFYQQVKIEHQDSNKTLLIQHWGRWTGGLHGYDLVGGQRKILKTSISTGDFEYREKLEAKRKRGYKQADLKNYRPSDPEDLRYVLTKQLGASVAQAQGIINYFGIEVATAEEATVRVPITTVGSADLPTTEGWGSW